MGLYPETTKEMSGPPEYIYPNYANVATKESSHIKTFYAVGYSSK